MTQLTAPELTTLQSRLLRCLVYSELTWHKPRDIDPDMIASSRNTALRSLIDKGLAVRRHQRSTAYRSFLYTVTPAGRALILDHDFRG